ncbi:MAG: hypothetical protein Q9227_004851 [Pyrenula ochraceoflavens]
MLPTIIALLPALCTTLLAASLAKDDLPTLSSSSMLVFYVNVTANDLTPSLTGKKLHQQLDAEPNYWDLAVSSGTQITSDSYFYPNGTAEQNASGSTSMGGVSQYPPYYPAINLNKISQMGPNGVTVATVLHNLTGASNPYIWMTPPTLGVRVSADDGYAKLLAPDSRQWYICTQIRRVHGADFTLLLVYTRAESETTPAGCADVNLIPQCTTPNFDPSYTYAGGQYALAAPCYNDASVIWG